jgi:hypothetical protein
MQCLLGRGIPLSGRFTLQVVFANKRLLDLSDSVTVNRLLPADTSFSRLLAGVVVM